MSVNYIDKSTGDLIRVAGQGKAEYGASTERKGDIVIPATTPGNFQSVSVVFAQAMPDNDYAVVIDEGGNTWAHCSVNVTSKTATGFTLFFYNAAGQDTPQMTFKYRAFKLYTDTEYNNLLNNAVLTSDVTDSITNGDMNPVTSNAVYDALAVIDSPITKVGTAINGDRFWSKRTGNVVEIMIDGTTGSNIPCAQSVVVAKVPKNALTISDVCIEIDSKSLVSAPESGHKRAWVDSTGNVCVFIVMPDLAATYTGNIYIGGTYITAE